jgi:ketosteroid isomerase-like protein
MPRSRTAERTLTKEEKDTLVDCHFESEVAGDIDAIVEGFVPGAEHDVAGSPGGPVHGGEAIAAFYRGLLSELRLDRFETLRRRYGDNHVVDDSILHATAIAGPASGREVAVRILHVFDFSDGLISRENAWLDTAALQEQLA